MSAKRRTSLRPVGFTMTDDQEAVREYGHRYVRGATTYVGTPDVHRDTIAEAINGVPRSSPR